MNQKSKTTEKSAPSKKSETDETPIEEKNNSDWIYYSYSFIFCSHSLRYFSENR